MNSQKKPDSLAMKEDNDSCNYGNLGSKDPALSITKNDVTNNTNQFVFDINSYNNIKNINNNNQNNFQKQKEKNQQINNVVIVQNQVEIKQEVPTIPKFKSTAIRMICPFCQAQIRTFVETHLNCMNLCCYCWTSCVLWTCFQLIRGKDLSCSDARHSCPKCGRTLGYYEAC